MQSAAAYRSLRLSIRWLPDEASEPTRTIVLTGARTGVFIDTRFLKGTRDIDWAFAGYRFTDPSSDEVEDSGTNTTLPDGNILEVGEMINPATRKMTPFEEIWLDQEERDEKTVLFVKNISGTSWQARVGDWQTGLGRGKDGVFWAWQAEKEGSGWTTKYSTVSAYITYLPDGLSIGGWEEGSVVDWVGDKWIVLERGRPYY
ncbi:hypothetical protein H0H81_000178 [Sphagnurus paluster]|uniref:Protein HRI1 n=1 Tax=Sphagnurus paluster TaxID=117069 RepID=A0A9P7K831_9AGAR|nr:hypothetical protein H0H81_000178 [Sphagnurus paluster]